MNWERVTEWFHTKIMTADPGSDVLVSSNIALPNKAFSHEGKSIWFELDISSGTQMGVTETKRLYLGIANIAVCVPLNSGTTRSNRLAELIGGLFSNQIASKGVFQLDAMHRLYISDVEQMPNIAVNEVNKNGVRISFEIYEDVT